MNQSPAEIKRALVSVSDKTGLEFLARTLHEKGVEIISTGGTGAHLSLLGIPYTSIEEITGNPEIFAGRVKTLGFRISAALLYRRKNHSDVEQAGEYGIRPIDLVVCNLYPFEEVAAKNFPDKGFDDVIENIDVGGPSMIRSAAKNFESVTVCVSPEQYPQLIEDFKANNGATSYELRKQFALEAFRLTAKYDSIITAELERRFEAPLRTFHLPASSAKILRYGENPHQKGFLYPNGEGLTKGGWLQGKEASYNNYLDADAAFACVSDLRKLRADLHAVAIVKHLNPCGAALAKNSFEALKLAWAGDPVSAFGGIICFSSEVDKNCALFLEDKFLEIIIAPSFSPEAREIFSSKKNLQLLALGFESKDIQQFSIRSISGGFLVQHPDNDAQEKFQTMTLAEFPREKQLLAQFGIQAGKHLKSNAIVIVGERDGNFSIWGAGMGNPNRLYSISQALGKARENGHYELGDAVLISDAFFPFADNIEKIQVAGIKYLVQPGGSIKDKSVIEICNEHGISMVFTGTRHFRH